MSAETMAGRQDAGAATSNLPMSYSEFPKICHTVPTVVLAIPIVLGLAGSTVTDQPSASRHLASASGEISLLTTGR